MGWRLQYAVRPHCGRGPSCSLLLLLAEKLHLASVWTSLPTPHFLLLFLRAGPQRGAPLLLPFYLGERGSGNTECVSDTLHHIQSSTLPCLFSSPPSPACSLPPSHLSSSLVPARTSLQSPPSLGISELLPASFHYFPSPFNWLRRCHIASAQRIRLWRLITAT